MRLIALLCSILTATIPTAAAAAEPAGERAVWRVSFDNDIVSQSDDGYTAGWSLERHSAAWDTWEGSRLSGFSRLVGRIVPGLGDDGEGGRLVRTAWGASQIMQTPNEISDPSLQLDDVPWAGTLGLFGSWTAVDDRRLNAVQLYIGCMGPCSQADEIQTFVHEDLDLHVIPEGWHTQLDTEALVNLNYMVRRKVASSSSVGVRGAFAGDLSVGAQVGVGSFFNVADVSMELRWGWGLPEGFSTIPEPAGRGVVMDPTPARPLGGWQVSFALVPRYVYFADVATLDGGSTADGRYHPGIEYESSVLQLVSEIRVQRGRLSVILAHFNYEDDIILTSKGTTLEWSNLSVGFSF